MTSEIFALPTREMKTINTHPLSVLEVIPRVLDLKNNLSARGNLGTLTLIKNIQLIFLKNRKGYEFNFFSSYFRPLSF